VNELSATRIASAVRAAVLEAATTLRADVLAALEEAARGERSERGRAVLGQLIENAHIARNERVPVCQDTGSVWVHVAVGLETCVQGDLHAEVDRAVAEAYREGGLRMSVVRDALLDRTNTGDNTPAFLDVSQRAGTGATVSVMLKGGGSDNASRVAMLAPAEGWDGVRRFVLETVAATATGACPPLVIGVGVGSTFDSVARLAKKALLRPLDHATEDRRVAELEAELLAAINATGIGPAGLGGDTTALGVRLLTAPCHIAALPVAVNVGCNALRSATVEVL
jgi:tartrate/fumarate subfamily iron-sulfur-dependent hydro-lyase alpha chain